MIPRKLPPPPQPWQYYLRKSQHLRELQESLADSRDEELKKRVSEEIRRTNQKLLGPW